MGRFEDSGSQTKIVNSLQHVANAVPRTAPMVGGLLLMSAAQFRLVFNKPQLRPQVAVEPLQWDLRSHQAAGQARGFTRKS